MDPRLPEAEPIFHEAVELPPAERESLLHERCGPDNALRNLVEDLLAFHDSGMGDFLQRSSDATTVATVPGCEAFPRLGRYEILRKIGEGGMGEVYEARQESPRRTVALKVIRPAALGPEALRRFRFEVQVLGQLDHLGIAQVHEAGEADTERGARPYFAMEYVHGRPLLDHVQERGLGVREKLELVAKVCDAISYAHQKGVLHRDLKPGNILVAESGGAEGQPKILDFGVARALHADIQLTTMHTQAGQLVGTLAYMSPEQVTGRADELDERSDIYQLGLVLYEVLTGRRPYDVEGLPATEAGRIIQEQEPARLSSTNTSFRGDVETIVAKALEKERERRYDSAAALAEDIRRHLADQPIVARPASALYRLRKLAKRRRDLALATMVAVVAAITVAALWHQRGLRLPTGRPLELEARRLTGLPRERSPVAGAISPSGEQLAYVDADGVHVLTIETGEVTDFPHPEGHLPVNVSWFPGADSLLSFEFVGTEVHAEVISTVSGERRGRLPVSGLRSSARLSPSGTRLLWTQGGSRTLRVGNIRGTEERVLLTAERQWLAFPTWGPDDSRIAFYLMGTGGQTPRLETIDLAGTRSIVIDDDPMVSAAGGGRALCWLPDGRLVYTREIDSPSMGDYEFWSIPVDPASGRVRGEPKRLLGWLESVVVTPTASADGRRLAFRRLSGWAGTPYALDIAGNGGTRGSPYRLSSSDWSERVGCWLDPDRFVSHSERGGNPDLYVQRRSDGNPELLLASPDDESGSCLAPDGRSLILRRSWTDPPRQEFWDLPLEEGEPRFLFESTSGQVHCGCRGSRCVLFEPRDGTLVVRELNPEYLPGPEIARLAVDPIGSLSVDPGADGVDARLSPDGEKILIVENMTRARVLDLSTGTEKELLRGGVQAGEWSADGTLVFLTGMDSRGPVYLLVSIDVETGERRTLVESVSQWLHAPRTSPDGSLLAYTAYSFDADFWMIEDF